MATKYYYTFRQTKDAYAIHLSSQVIIGLLEVGLFILAIAVLVFYRRQLYNVLFYSHKRFTEDNEAIDLTQKLCLNFKNAYSLNYLESDRFLQQEAVRDELPEAEYSPLISKTVLSEKVSCLFDRYQQDRMDKNFSAIAECTLEPLKSKHQYFDNDNTTDIVCRHKLSEIVPLNFAVREELKRFLVQINGEIISFQVNDRGCVTRGRSQLRCFTQYWDVALDVSDKIYLVAICTSPD